MKVGRSLPHLVRRSSAPATKRNDYQEFREYFREDFHQTRG